MKRVLNVLYAVCIAAAVVSGSLLAVRLAANHREQQAVEQLRQEKTIAGQQAAASQGEADPDQTESDLLPDYRVLAEQNPDLVGWLAIEGTIIDYPVMQREEDYYLTRDFNGNPSAIGLPFADIRSDLSQPTQGHNLFIHGHNLKDGKMFQALEGYQDPDFAAEHALIRLDTLEERRSYRVIGVLLVPLKSGLNPYNFLDTTDPEQVSQMNQALEQSSVYPSGQNIMVGDSMLTLATCSYHTADGRLLVMAVQETESA